MMAIGDPVGDAINSFKDKALIYLDELKWVVFDKQFWLGTMLFAALALVLTLDGCMRRGV